MKKVITSAEEKRLGFWNVRKDAGYAIYGNGMKPGVCWLYVKICGKGHPYNSDADSAQMEISTDELQKMSIRRVNKLFTDLYEEALNNPYTCPDWLEEILSKHTLPSKP